MIWYGEWNHSADYHLLERKQCNTYTVLLACLVQAQRNRRLENENAQLLRALASSSAVLQHHLAQSASASSAFTGNNLASLDAEEMA
jgi:hypothetical protein